MRWTRGARLTGDAACGRRSRVVLTPRRWRQVRGKQFPGATVARKPGHRLSDSHILEPQSGAVFDAAEGFEAYSHDLWARVSVIGSPSSKPSNDPGSEGERPFWMWVLLLRGSALEFGRERFKHRLVIRLESLDQFFLGLSITGADQLHDRDRRHSSCGDELDHDPGFANVGLLDIKTRGLERAEELLDGPAPAVEVYDPTCFFWASHNVSSEKPPMDRLAIILRWQFPNVHHGQADCIGQIGGGTWVWPAQRHRREAQGKLGRPLFTARRRRNFHAEPGRFRQAIHKRKQLRKSPGLQFDLAVPGCPDNQIHIRRTSCEVLVNVD